MYAQTKSKDQEQMIVTCEVGYGMDTDSPILSYWLKESKQSESQRSISQTQSWKISLQAIIQV